MVDPGAATLVVRRQATSARSAEAVEISTGSYRVLVPNCSTRSRAQTSSALLDATSPHVLSLQVLVSDGRQRTTVERER